MLDTTKFQDFNVITLGHVLTVVAFVQFRVRPPEGGKLVSPFVDTQPTEMNSPENADLSQIDGQRLLNFLLKQQQLIAHEIEGVKVRVWD